MLMYNRSKLFAMNYEKALEYYYLYISGKGTNS